MSVASCTADLVASSFKTWASEEEQEDYEKVSAATESDAASTSEDSSSFSESFDTDSFSSPVSLAVVISQENAWLWSLVESHQANAFRDTDVYLVYTFLELASVGEIGAKAVKLLLAAIRLLHLCSFEVHDICSVLAHASSYFHDIDALCGSRMSQQEKGHILVALIYLAHTYVLDISCPLRFWHQHLFRNYSSIKQLDKAVMRLLMLRRYILRVEEEDLSKRFARLQHSVEGGIVIM